MADPEVRCSQALSVTETIGPRGGKISLPPVWLHVQPLVLEKPTEITLVRTPHDAEHPERCNFRDRVTVQPLGLATQNDRPFVLYWRLWASEVEDVLFDDWICPKMSWTGDGRDLECYQMAATTLLGTGHSIRSWSPHCQVGFRRPLRGRDEIVASFFSDRLAHFRLMPPGGDWDDADREKALTGFYHHPLPSVEYMSRKESCTPTPPSDDRIVYAQNEGRSWPSSCRSNADCKPDYYCGRRACEGWGVCWRRELNCGKLPPRPVCGCDGETYATKCAANRDGVEVKLNRGCDEPPPPPQTMTRRRRKMIEEAAKKAARPRPSAR